MKQQLRYRKNNGWCASQLLKNKKSKTLADNTLYLLDKTKENAVVLSENEDIYIYGEERIALENKKGSQTYLSGNNQSVMDEVTSTGQVHHIEYDDTGKTEDKTKGYGYNGEKVDETGNIYLRARYYNPRIGQFVQIDNYKGTQENLISQNRYTYCLNNQYKYTDPSGHFVLEAALGLTGLGTVAGILGIGLLAVGVITLLDKKRNQNTTSKLINKASKAKKTIKDYYTNKKTIKKIQNNFIKNVAMSIPAVRHIVTIAKIAKAIPQPCPTGVGWNQLPKDLVSTIYTLPGAAAFVNEYLGKLSRVKRYNTEQVHHIVPKKAWSIDGKVRHDFYLDTAREVIKHHLPLKIEDPENKVSISNTLHRYLHTKIYYTSLDMNFNQNLIPETPSNTMKVIALLRKYRVILKGLSEFVKGIK